MAPDPRCNPRYTGALSLPPAASSKQGGGRMAGFGVIGARNFTGLSPRGWKVVEVDSEEVTRGDNGARLAIDGDPSTGTRAGTPTSSSPTITIDMGQPHRIAGFVFLPRGTAAQRHRRPLPLRDQRGRQSLDRARGRRQLRQRAQQPDQQEVRFAPITARYFRYGPPKSGAMAGPARPVVGDPSP